MLRYVPGSLNLSATSGSGWLGASGGSSLILVQPSQVSNILHQERRFRAR